MILVFRVLSPSLSIHDNVDYTAAVPGPCQVLSLAKLSLKDFLSTNLKPSITPGIPVMQRLKWLIAVCEKSHTGDLKPASNCSMDLQLPAAGQTFSNNKARRAHGHCTTSARKIIISMSDTIFYIPSWPGHWKKGAWFGELMYVDKMTESM